MLSAESNAEADNTYRGLDNLGYPKKESNNCFIIRCFDENKDTKTHHKNKHRLFAAESLEKDNLKNSTISKLKL